MLYGVACYMLSCAYILFYVLIVEVPLITLGMLFLLSGLDDDGESGRNAS